MKDYLVGDKPVCAGDDDTKSWSPWACKLHVPFDRIGCLGLLVCPINVKLFSFFCPIVTFLLNFLFISK